MESEMSQLRFKSRVASQAIAIMVCHVERSRDISQYCRLREIVRDSSTALGMAKASESHCSTSAAQIHGQKKRLSPISRRIGLRYATLSGGHSARARAVYRSRFMPKFFI